MSAIAVRIESLHVYPVKSCAAIDLDAARIGLRGFEFDRHWMIVDDEGRFLTQRTHPALARVRVRLLPDALELSYPGRPGLRVAQPASSAAAPRSVRVWNDTTLARPCGGDADRWLSEALGQPVALVEAGELTQREPPPDFRGDIAAPVSFPDGYPILVTSTASLADLRARMPDDPQLPMNRFRPNLVISGLAPWEEDRVHELDGEGVVLRLVKACTRCAITTIDQQRGVAVSDPVSVLRGFRFDRRLRGVTFGQNAVIVAGAGRTLRVGQMLRASLR